MFPPGTVVLRGHHVAIRVIVSGHARSAAHHETLVAVRQAWLRFGQCPAAPAAWRAKAPPGTLPGRGLRTKRDRKSTRLNSSHVKISYAVFCLKKKKRTQLREHVRRQ